MTKKEKTMLRYILLLGALLFPADSYAGTGPAGELQPFVKCGTPAVLADIETNGFRAMAEGRVYSYIDLDALPGQAVSAEGHFRAHYDTVGTHAPSLLDEDVNGVPDYVDSTLVYLEYAWDLIVDDLGYGEPLSDEGRGGGDEVDIYLLNLSGYGLTYPEAEIDGSSPSYMIIDNNFSEDIFYTHGYDALRVTTAHEFFHVIHFTYFNDFSHMLWWMEQSAVWMEERAWDDVNDYLDYLHHFFDQKLTSLDYNDRWNNFMYGAAIWPMYLAKRFGDDQIRLIWDHLRTTGNHDISAFDDVVPGELAAAFNEFAVWNYFTGSRANTLFHHDADLFDIQDVVDAVHPFAPAAGAVDASALTSRYVEFTFTGDEPDDDALEIVLAPRNGGTFAGTLVLYETPTDYRFEALDIGENVITLDRSWDRAAAVISCTSTSGIGFIIDYAGDRTEITLVEETVPSAFTVSTPQPNPFNPSTAIGFTLPGGGDVAVNAYNLQGQTVDEVVRGFFPAGAHRISWRPDGLAGGIYLIRVVTPYGIKTVKSLYLK